MPNPASRAILFAAKSGKAKQIYAFRFWIEGGFRDFIFSQCLVVALVSVSDKVSPMDYASPRAAHESGEFAFSSQWGETDEP